MDSQEKQYLPLRWLAPELRERILGSDPRLSDIGVSPSESLWSLGITIWEVATLSQHLPFRQVTDRAFQTLTSFIGTELLGQIDLQVIGTIHILRQHNFGFFLTQPSIINSFIKSFLQFIFSNSPIYLLQILFISFFALFFFEARSKESIDDQLT